MYTLNQKKLSVLNFFADALGRTPSVNHRRRMKRAYLKNGEAGLADYLDSITPSHLAKRGKDDAKVIVDKMNAA